jgi:D-cysteine desulfhydrase family pyridoxal phosphate-dependent enzyme
LLPTAFPPRLRLAALPTPVEELPSLSRALGRRLRIKRDDLTGLALGGNKTRKLELLTADALAQGADTLVTAGALQSNHCRQTAAAAARLGLRSALLLTGEPVQSPGELPRPTHRCGNLLLDELLGAELCFAGSEPREVALAALAARLEAEGRRPYLIPYGGSNALGALAYALALEELLAQGPAPGLICCASSSGGTQAGLLLGARLLGYRGRILGISVDPPAPILRELVASLANAAAARLGIAERFSAPEVWVEDRFRGEGYGVVGPLERGAIRRLAREDGILLDPVYTGRAMGGLLELAGSGELEARDLLFWHTGGIPALFADGEALLEG